jgi:tRNA(Ile)-lysidine synthase
MERRPNPRDRKLELHAERLIAQHELIPPDAPIVVGISGGPDSVALLDFLVARRPKSEIVAAHVNHGLRGEESDEDQRFVEELAAGLQIRVMTARVDPVRRGASLEESARKLRYAALRRIAHSARTRHVAVAHTADDQAETVLLRLIRGAGLTGLGGMHPHRTIHGLELVRPLLTTTRAEVLDYVKRRNLAFRNDSSNQSTDPRRNFVRLELLPRIQQMNPSIQDTLLREAALFREADAHLGAEARRALAGLTLERTENKIELDAEGLLLYPRLLSKYVVRFALQELNGDILDLSSAHIDALHSLLTSQPGRSADIPMGIRARRERGRLVLCKGLLGGSGEAKRATRRSKR